MKDSYIALSPLGACAFFLAGFVFGQSADALAARDVLGFAMMLLIASLIMTAAYFDARQPIDEGKYKRHGFLWRPLGTDERVMTVRKTDG